MKSLLFVFASVFIFAGCSNFQITGIMCDNIKTDSLSPNQSECRRYSDREAQIAFDKENELLSSEDAIKYTQ